MSGTKRPGPGRRWIGPAFVEWPDLEAAPAGPAASAQPQGFESAAAAGYVSQVTGRRRPGRRTPSRCKIRQGRGWAPAFKFDPKIGSARVPGQAAPGLVTASARVTARRRRASGGRTGTSLAAGGPTTPGKAARDSDHDARKLGPSCLLCWACADPDGSITMTLFDSDRLGKTRPSVQVCQRRRPPAWPERSALLVAGQDSEQPCSDVMNVGSG